MSELLEWLELASASAVVQSVTTYALIIVYSIHAVMIRKGCYLVAFLLCEFIGYSYIFDAFTNDLFYGCYALIYCGLFWHIAKSASVLQLCAVMLVIVFDFGMMIDETLHGQNESFLYDNYAFIVVVVHVCVIITSSRGARIRVGLVVAT